MINKTNHRQFWGRPIELVVYDVGIINTPIIEVCNIYGDYLITSGAMTELTSNNYSYILPFDTTISAGNYYFHYASDNGDILGNFEYISNSVLERDTQNQYVTAVIDVAERNVVKGAVDGYFERIKESQETDFSNSLDNYLFFQYMIPKINSDIEIENEG